MSASPGNRRLYDHAIDEIPRLYALFGIPHRFSTAPIDAGKEIPAGSVVRFNYLDFHLPGFTDAGEFEPERWEHCKAKDANFIPFGVNMIREARGLRLCERHFAAHPEH